ncbi:MAG: hypothetical protein VX834_09535 [Myxococcota bacterium]|nr:hypothetical protein [Myxococcota bacterium]
MKLKQVFGIAAIALATAALTMGCATPTTPVSQEAAGICEDACADTEASCLFQCELDDTADSACFDKCEREHDSCATGCEQ